MSTFKLQRQVGDRSQYGRQSVEIGSLKISLLCEQSYLRRVDVEPLGYSYVDVSFGRNRILSGLTIFELTDQKSFRGVVDALGPWIDDESGKVADVLSSQFRDFDVLYCRRPSRTPVLVGALVRSQTAKLFFMFRFRRGALGSVLLPSELEDSFEIEPGQTISGSIIAP